MATIVVLLIASPHIPLGHAQNQPQESQDQLLKRIDALQGQALFGFLDTLPADKLLLCLPDLKTVTARSGVNLRVGRVRLHQRRFREATLHLEAVEKESSLAFKEAQKLLSRLQKRSIFKRNKLGVILPLTGRYGAIGRTAFNAIELAVSQNPKIELVVQDSAQSDRSIASMMEVLVYEENVSAVIGPIGSIESLAAVRAAEDLEVPIISLSSREQLANEGTFVFRHRLTRSGQAIALARYAVEEMGHKSFAILYPDTAYGLTMTKAFWQTVETLGGEVRGCQPYSTEGGQYHPPIKKLIGRYHVEHREVDPFWEVLNRKSKDKGHHVPPIVDFDALFIPDGIKRLRVILPFLSYWDVILKNDPTRTARSLSSRYGGEIPPLVQILGAAGFNDQRLMARPIPLAENSVFVDAFYPDTPEGETFDRLWKAREGRAPPTLAAHAYDAVQLVLRTLSKSNSRADVRRNLLDTTDYIGIFGATRVNGDGEVIIDPRMLTLRADQGIVPHGATDLTPQIKTRRNDEDAP